MFSYKSYYAGLIRDLKKMRAKPLSGRDYAGLCSPYLELLHRFNNAGEFGKALEKAGEVYSLVPDSEVFLKNQLLNRIEFAEKKSVLSSRARGLDIEVTKACNIACVMCFQRGAPRSTLELSQRSVNEIIGLLPYAERVNWVGGEPLLSRRLKRLIKTAAKFPRLEQFLVTNGTLLDRKWANFLVDNRVRVNFSVDGFDKALFEKIRRGAKFGQVLEYPIL